MSSFIVSGRRTYIDVLTRPYVETTSAAGSGYYFYDLNAKYNHRFSDKDEVFISGYFGRDVFSFQSADAGFGASIPWGNAMVPTLEPRGDRQDVLERQRVLHQLRVRVHLGARRLRVWVQFWGGGLDPEGPVELVPQPAPRNRTGVEHVFHEFIPTSFFFRQGDNEFDFGEATVSFSHESAAYLEDIVDVTDAFRLHLGLRGSDFRHVGPFTRITPGDNVLAPDDSTTYRQGELVKRYGGWEPRVSANS